MKEAQPYSASQREMERCGSTWHTRRSWSLAFSMAVSALAIRSCNKGKAQLPCRSGTHTRVLNPIPTVIGRLPGTLVG